VKEGRSLTSQQVKPNEREEKGENEGEK